MMPPAKNGREMPDIPMPLGEDGQPELGDDGVGDAEGMGAAMPAPALTDDSCAAAAPSMPPMPGVGAAEGLPAQEVEATIAPSGGDE